MEDYTYARKIKDYMVKEGLNQVMMAERLGVPTSTLCNWLKGNRMPSDNYKKKIDAFMNGKQEEASIVKNGSGYYDPTMHKALKNIITDSAPTCLRGDIYKVEMKNNTERKMLVVGCDERKSERYISILMLKDEPKGKNIVPIKAGAMMYADCDMVTYIDRTLVTSFVRTATEEEMRQIDTAILEGLGINAGDADLYNKLQTTELLADRMREEKDELENEVYNLRKELENAKVAPTVDTDEVVRLKAMLEVYKEQNKQYLEMLIG